jgi:hypothetical protein
LFFCRGFELSPTSSSLPLALLYQFLNWCRLRDYSALRASPFGSPCGRSPPLRGVVEPGLFFCRGFELSPTSSSLPLALLYQFLNWCRLRDSNPRPTVYKTVALPLC